MDSVVRLKLDSGTFDANVKQAGAGLARMEKECRALGGTLAVVEKEQLAYVKAIGQMDTKSEGARQKMRELGDAIKNATMVYNELTEEEKNSDFGKALAQSIDELKQRLAPLKDMVADLDEEFKNMADDQAFSKGMNLMTNSIGACASAMVAWSGNSEDMQKMITELAKIQTTVSAVDALTKAFQKQNAVLLKNPYVLIAAAIAAVAYAATKALKEYTKLSDETQRNIELGKSAIEQYAEEATRIDSLHKILSDTNRSYAERKKALESLNSIVEDYHGAITKEGELIGDNVTALQEYIDKLNQAAIAQAAFDKKVELNKRVLEIELEMSAKKDDPGQERKQEVMNFFQRLGNMLASGPGASGNMGGYAPSTNNTYHDNSYEIELAELQRQMEYLDTKISADSVIGKSGGNGGSGSSSVSSPKFSMDNIRDIGIGQFTSEDALNERLQYWLGQIGAATDSYSRTFAEAMVDKIQQYLDVTPVAASIGMSQEAVAELEDSINSLLDDMRADIEPIEIEVDAKGTGKAAKDAVAVQKSWSQAAAIINNAGSALQNVDNKGVNIAGMLMQAIGNVILGFTSGMTQEGMKGGVWGWIAASVAGLATMTATIAAIKSQAKFAEGGIVGGQSYVGDNLLFAGGRINSGEMVINQTDQRALYDAIHGGNLVFGGGRMEFRIRGKNLVAVQRNYERSR